MPNSLHALPRATGCKPTALDVQEHGTFIISVGRLLVFAITITSFLVSTTGQKRFPSAPALICRKKKKYAQIVAV